MPSVKTMPLLLVFETMREYGANLIIDEKTSGSAGFTKSVTIRFDGKNQYIIKTYRPQDFPASDRYTVEASGEQCPTTPDSLTTP
jgi:hypothetical protein